MKISALILVAGRGKRISKYTNKPKCLLKVKRRTILERNIDILLGFGFKNIYIVIGYKSKLIKKEINKLKRKIKIKYVYNKKYKTHGNSYSLYLGLMKLNSDVLFIDGDVIYDKKILYDYLKHTSSNSILIGKGNKNDVECGKVFGTEKLVKRIIEKRIFKEKKHKFLGEAIGINKLNKKYIKYFIKFGKNVFKKKENLNLNWDTFYDSFLLKKLPMKFFFTSDNKWVEIDNYKDYKKAKKLIK